MKKITMILTLMLLTSIVKGQEQCPCCTDLHQAFDFWVGDWVVYDTLGKEIGRNVIVKLHKDCILQENWTSSSGFTGTSYNYVNRGDSSWNQLWIDNNGGHLVLNGGKVGETMVLQDELKQGKEGNLVRNKIIWTPLGDGSVSQNWLVVDEHDKEIKQLFLGIYKPRE